MILLITPQSSLWGQGMCSGTTWMHEIRAAGINRLISLIEITCRTKGTGPGLGPDQPNWPNRSCCLLEGAHMHTQTASTGTPYTPIVYLILPTGYCSLQMWRACMCIWDLDNIYIILLDNFRSSGVTIMQYYWNKPSILHSLANSCRCI